MEFGFWVIFEFWVFGFWVLSFAPGFPIEVWSKFCGPSVRSFIFIVPL